MKVHLTTLGCPKNQVDSELMLGMLTEAGFPLTTEPEEAECLIVNTCAFIDRAREESVNTILELARLKETGRCRALIVTRSEEHTSELQSHSDLVCRLLLEKKKTKIKYTD